MKTQATNPIPVQRKQALSSVVALMAKRHGLDHMDAAAAVFVAALHLEAGNTAASAYDQARHLAIKIRRDAAQRKIVNLCDRIKQAMPALQAG